MARKPENNNAILSSRNPLFFEAGADPLQPLDRPELVFGLVGPVGVDRELICHLLGTELKEYGYVVKRIKISSLIALVPKYKSLQSKKFNEYDRISALMDAGNYIREKSDMGDALAVLAVSEIAEERRKLNEKESFRYEDTELEHIGRTATAYILDSLKHPQEVRTLRAIYGSGFRLISMYADREERVNNLAKRIAKSNYQPANVSQYRDKAEALIARDEKEEGNSYGQDVQGTFPLADLFLDMGNNDKPVSQEVERFLKIIFNNPFITPTIDEVGMFHAEAEAWRSADLSRQVGAAICSLTGEVLTLGCNEVPKSGGGLYWEGEAEDSRDFKIGHDEGANQKRLMVAEILNRFKGTTLVSKTVRPKIDELIKKAIKGENDPVLDGLQALNVIEYGRTVHAEMAAITDAARRGVSIKGAVVYVNTYPCHLCARHIISSGIKKVVYIEPYPKSLTETLYKDSMETVETRSGKVVFRPFMGIAPRMYGDAFKKIGKRKEEDGAVVKWEKAKASTRLKRYVLSYIAMERGVIRSLLPKLNKIS